MCGVFNAFRHVLAIVVVHLRKCSGHVRVRSGYGHVFFSDSIIRSSVGTIVSIPDKSSHFRLVAFSA